MSFRGSLLALAAAVGAAAVMAPPALAQQDVEASGPAPLSAYGELPEVEDAALSPSGNRIAALVTIKGKRVILFIENQSKVIRAASVTDMKIRSFEWIGENQLLIVTSRTEKLGYTFTTDKHEFYIGMVISVDDSRKPEVIFARRRDMVDAIFGEYGIRQIDGRWYGFFGALELQRVRNMDYEFRHGRPFLYRVDLQDFSSRRIDHAASANESKDWLVDASGDVAATFIKDRSNGKWKLFNASNDIIATGQAETGRSGLIGLGKDGTTVIYFERDDNGFNDWFEVPLAGGTAKPFLDDIDVDRLYFENSTGHLLGYLRGGSDPDPVFADPEHASAVRKVRKAFKGMDMQMVGWTDDLGKAIVRTSGNGDSGTWFSVDIENLRAEAFAYERGAIGPVRVGEISTFTYQASDGLELDGILTLPPGSEGKDLPTIVLPHGGPHAHDTESFDWWAQAFASRGYAVFQPNFRGSTHKTGTFRKAGYGEWGRKMQTDKSDGLAALAEAGIADPTRACIVGASYGGYAALAGVTLQTDIYRCAVAVAPVSDIKRMFQEDYRASAKARTTRASLLEQLGSRDLWDSVSPRRHAAQASAPILLIHGKDDTVVPYDHSKKMADALKDAGKPYELVTLDGEDHWLSRSETRHRMLKAAVEFVEQHNPPD